MFGFRGEVTCGCDVRTAALTILSEEIQLLSEGKTYAKKQGNPKKSEEGSGGASVVTRLKVSVLF